MNKFFSLNKLTLGTMIITLMISGCAEYSSLFGIDDDYDLEHHAPVEPVFEEEDDDVWLFPDESEIDFNDPQLRFEES